MKDSLAIIGGDTEWAWRQNLTAILAVGVGLYAALRLSALLAPTDLEAFVFWPLTAFCIAALKCRPISVIGIVIGFWWWGVGAAMSPLMVTAQLLTLVGPVLYVVYGDRWPDPKATVGRRLNDLLKVTLLAIVPSTLIGTFILFWWAPDLPLSALSIIWPVFVLSELAGVIVFLPVLNYWLNRAQQSSLQGQYLGATVVVLLVPQVMQWIGQPQFAQPSLFLALPFLTWLAQKSNRPTLSHVLLLMFIGHLSMAYFGVGGYDPINLLPSMIALTMLLVSAFLTIDILHAMRVDRDQALAHTEWLATHDIRANALNERGLMNWAKQQSSLHDYAGIIFRPVNKNIFLETLTWEQLAAVEQQIIDRIKHQLPIENLTKISDLSFIVVVKPRELSKPALLPLLHIDVDLQDTTIVMDGAIAAIQHLNDDMEQSLAKLNTLWGSAHTEPYDRIVIHHNDDDISARTHFLIRFQRYREAVETGGLELWLQPILRLQNHVIDKAEVLTRLRVDDDIITPGEFLPVFQSFNYLTEFDRHVLLNTFARLPQILDDLGRQSVLNVNLSGATVGDKTLISWIKNVLEQQRVRPQDICLEITESDLVRDRATAISNVLALRELGFSVAIDDFGAGLAGFEYLNQFSVDVLKLDGQFISDVDTNLRHQAIVRSMVDVAKSYNLQLVAEFVDSQQAQDCLRELGVDYAQGYFIGKPQASRAMKTESP